MKQLQYKSAPIVVEKYDDKTRQIKGYASVFGVVDSDKDSIKRGSFNRTLKSWGPEGANRIKLVSQHDISRPVARIDVLREDEKGLYMEAAFGTHTDGDDHYKMAKEGILTEFSIGFVPVQSEENTKGGYDITEIKLYEVSMVTIAANEEAKVTGVKSENIDTVLSLVSKSKIDAETKHTIEYELLKLKTSFQETTHSSSDTDSVVEEELLTMAKAFNIN